MVACYGLTQFEWDEELDLKNFPVWLCVFLFLPPRLPLYAAAVAEFTAHACPYACEMLYVPVHRGFACRLINGVPYHGFILTSEEEQKQREPVYGEKLRPWIEDFDREWGKCIAEMLALYQPLREAEPLEKLSDIELLLHLGEYWRVNQRQWDVHYYVFWIIGSIYILFEDTCVELTGIGRQDPIFTKLMGGFDNMLFRVNKELWRLGDRANELGLAQLFLTTEDNEEAMRGLDGSEAGRKWLDQYREFLNVHGWRYSPNMLDWASANWMEKPSLGLTPIRKGMAKGGAFALDEERVIMTKEREEAEREVLAKIPVDKRDWFEKLMRSGQRCQTVLEEHNYYLDLPANALGRNVAREYGRRFAQAGVIDEPDDVYYLMPGEIKKAAIPLERVNLRPYVKRYKEEHERYLKMEFPPMLGDMAKLGWLAQVDAIPRTQMAPQLIRPELKADLYGCGSAPGVAEGIARVIFSELQLDQVQPGEILVSPLTMAPWTPVFSIISGVVTDMGGMLSHAVIVGREYGIPAISGTMEATKKIKTGDRIRVDGNMCAVYILEKGA